MEKDCSNCIHHQNVTTLDDCPAVCWNCVASKEDKPAFEAVESK